MKKAIIIIAVLTLITGGLAFVWIALRQSPSTTDTRSQPVSFPVVNTTNTGEKTNQSSNGFLANPEVHPDPNNPGYYFVGTNGENDANAIPFQIVYIAETNYFNIAITAEPIGESRLKAETYLMQLLGATKDQMCALQYGVYSSNEVNTQYSGINLGFSFCPNAVKLPL